MKFEIDVSGYDIFNDTYAICIYSNASKNLIKGFKFSEELVKNLVSNWKSNKYRYKYNLLETKRGIFKVRIYSIILYYLFKSIENLEGISLTICKDFKGRENDITQSLKYFLEEVLKVRMGKPLYQKLPTTSKAHIYAGLMRRDSENLLKTYVKISLSDIEKFLKKRKKKVTSMGR